MVNYVNFSFPPAYTSPPRGDYGLGVIFPDSWGQNFALQVNERPVTTPLVFKVFFDSLDRQFPVDILLVN